MIAALINHLWQSTLFCAAVWLISLALRNNGASLRHSLWVIASLKFLVPFAALYHLGALVGFAGTEPQPGLLQQALETTAPVISPTTTLIVLSPAPATSWSMFLALAWMAGASITGLRWWLGWRAADSMARAARPVPGSPPDILVTDAAIEPSAARVFHPVVLLPVALLRRLTPAQLDAVLAHEREHIERRDNLVAHLHRLVEMLFWFHPLVWWIGRQLVEERERACDEAVLQSGHDARDYAEGILAVCRHCQPARRLVTASAASGDLSARIRGIIGNAAPAAPGLVKSMVLFSCGLATALAPVIAGAVDEAARRHERLQNDTRVFRTAQIFVAAAKGPMSNEGGLTVEPRAIVIRHTTLRELVALTYDVSAAQVKGGGEWLDSPRYDIRAELSDPLTSPDDFEPVALRGAVIELLASRFDLQVHINQRCESPCGRRALFATADP